MNLKDSVRVANIGLGMEAAHITAIHTIPDAPTRDEVGEAAQPDRKPNESKNVREGYINLEVTFAYHGLPSGDGMTSRERNLQYVEYDGRKSFEV